MASLDHTQHLLATTDASIMDIISLEESKSPLPANKKESRRIILSGLYNRVVMDIISHNQGNKYYKGIGEDFSDENFHKALVTVIAHCLYVSLNLSHPDLGSLSSLGGLDSFELWTGISIFLAFETKMPRALKAHLLELEDKIINRDVWLQDRQVIHILNSRHQSFSQVLLK